MRILFVCMGNICRSPMAEGVFNALIEERGVRDRFELDSAGTHAYHVGEPPDKRAQRTMKAEREIDISGQRARRVVGEDFERFDLVIAMDRENLRNLEQQCPEQYRDRVRLLLEFVDGSDTLDVPDPYYGPGDGFLRVLDLVEAGCRGLLDDIDARGS